MQIKINLKIFLFLAIFIITKQIKIYTIIMTFALIHELGHVLMGIILGFKPSSISIIPTGFSVDFETECKNYNIKIKNGNLLTIKKIAIAIAGPMTNLVLILIMAVYYSITKRAKILNIPVDLAIYSNILILIFNLIPVYPLDGGRILKGMLHIFCGLYDSYTLTNKISNTTIIILTMIGSIAILVYKNIAILIILAYLWALTINQNKKFNLKMKIWNKIRENKN